MFPRLPQEKVHPARLIFLGEFVVFAKGRKTIGWCARLCHGERFAKHIGPKTTRIAGAELGGVALAASTSMASGLPFVIIRNAKKDYGTKKMYEGKIEKGDCVLLVEDVATTGGQVLEAAKTIAEAGATVEKIIAVIDRQEGARENIEGAGFTFGALMTKTDLGIDE